MNLNKIALGTAQLGLKYGINNSSGKPSQYEIESILNFALSHGINSLDTAISYGDSESILGKVGVDKFEIYTKLPSCKNLNNKEIESWIFKNYENSLSRLKKNSLSGLLLHRPLELLEVNGHLIYKALEKIRDQKLVNKIGVSVYDPEELSQIIDCYEPDIVQIPLNIIDSRWDVLLTRLKSSNIEVHVRSVFLQGLLLMESSKRKELFPQWSSLWDNFENWLSVSELQPIQACIGGVLHNDCVSKLVLGMETLLQLKEIVSFSKGISSIEIPSVIRSNDLNLLNPSNWN